MKNLKQFIKNVHIYDFTLSLMKFAIRKLCCQTIQIYVYIFGGGETKHGVAWVFLILIIFKMIFFTQYRLWYSAFYTKLGIPHETHFFSHLKKTATSAHFSSKKLPTRNFLRRIVRNTALMYNLFILPRFWKLFYISSSNDYKFSCSYITFSLVIHMITF